MTQYEVKYKNKNDWMEIPEKDFLLNLLDVYPMITQVLLKMFEGEEIITSSAIYRIGNRQ